MSALRIREIAHAGRPQGLGVKPLQFADLVASAIRHGAIGPADIIRRVIVLDVKRAALSPVGVTGVVNLKSRGWPEAVAGGTALAGPVSFSTPRPIAAREVKVLRGLGM
jgi:hypothetical protein